VDDLRLGRIVRVLRHRLSLRQTDVARRVGVTQDVVSRIERGLLNGISLGRLRSVLAVFGAELVVFVRWRGGDLDRVLDERHASMVEAMLRRLVLADWEVHPEVSYSSFGERGSIDLLAWHAASRTLLVIEMKTELTSVEETLRKHDAKARLAAAVASERFGWRPLHVVRLLVLPEHRTARRHIDNHAGTFSRVYPLRGFELRRWLADPTTPIRDGRPSPTGGLLFLPSNDGVGRKQPNGPRRRIRAMPPGSDTSG
jgi:transcriptional regulator with XRE-family HTH domain